MAAIIDLFVEVSTPLKVGWTLWLSAGLGLAVWHWLGRGVELQMATPDVAVPFEAEVEQSAVAVETSGTSPEPAAEQPFRANRKSRSFRRKS